MSRSISSFCRLAGAVLLLLAASGGAVDGPQSSGAEQDYVLHCRGCHGADGAGVPHRVPSFKGGMPRFMRTVEGREFLLRVPGAANSALSDAALAAVLNWIAMRFAAEELDGDPRWFTAEEVAAARHNPLPAVRSARSEVVRHLAAGGIVVADDY